MLEFHTDAAAWKAVISCTERHCTDSGQKSWTHANWRLNEIASLPHRSSIRSEGWRKEPEICSLLETVKKSPGGRKKEERKKKASLSTAAITKTKMDTNEKLQNLKSWLHKDSVVRAQILAVALLALSCILEAMYYSKAKLLNWVHVGLAIHESQSISFWIYFWKGWVLLPTAKTHLQALCANREAQPQAFSRLLQWTPLQASHPCNLSPFYSSNLKQERKACFRYFLVLCWQGILHLSPHSCLYEGQNRRLYPPFPSF